MSTVQKTEACRYCSEPRQRYDATCGRPECRAVAYNDKTARKAVITITIDTSGPFPPSVALIKSQFERLLKLKAINATIEVEERP